MMREDTALPLISRICPPQPRSRGPERSVGAARSVSAAGSRGRRGVEQ